MDSLSDDDWARLTQRATHLTFAAGQRVVEAHQKLPGIHILRAGRVRIERKHLGQPVALAELGPGEVFGEIALLDNEAEGASADVRALGEVTIDFVSESALQTLFERDAALEVRFYRWIAASLARRLRETSALIPLLLLRHHFADLKDE